jgi:hypothetical protein
MGEASGQKSFAERFSQAFDDFDSKGSLTGAETIEAVKPSDHVQPEAANLRLALSLRGRTDPNSLIGRELDPHERLEVLDLVLRDCDASPAGQWLLTDVARRREFEQQGSEVIEAMLGSIEGADEITDALRAVFLGSVDVDLLSANQLRALLAVEPAVLGIAPHYPDGAEIRRLLAYRSRLEEFDRFVADGIVGRTEELAELLKFVRAETFAKQRVASLLLWGTGGIGKSTLVSKALSELMREDKSSVVPVHLDFDRRELALEDTVGLSLEVLRQIGTSDPEADRRLKDLRDLLRRGLRENLGANQEIRSESSAVDLLARMRGCLAFLRSPRRRIVLVLDTFENVESAGLPALMGLRRWIEQLTLISGAPEVRLVVAGRSDPASNGTLTALGWQKPIVRKLEDFPRNEACAFLTSGGVPISAAEAIFDALGGNPLVLALIRRMFQSTGSLQEIEGVAADVKRGVVPEDILQGVLYDRFLKHLQSEDARNYAHPGLVLPEITPDLIRRILAPLEGEPGMSVARSKEIFESLASATWLVHREGDTLAQRPDVRRITLKLMTADPRRSAEVERVRLAAIVHHAASQSASDRAALAYHLLMRVKEKEDLDLLDGINLSGTGAAMRRRADDLPERARAFVEVLDFESGTGRNRRAVAARSIPAEQALTELPDDLWQSFIGGDGSRRGEGDRLVDQGDPSMALDLWRRRPAGQQGCPPTFVLRALADTGDWAGSEADIATLTDELSDKSVGRETDRPRTDERLYWTLQYALLAKPFGFARGSEEFRPLIKLLKRFHDRKHKSNLGREFVALSAIVEGLCEERILPERLFDSSGPYASCTRMYLQRGRWSGRVLQWHVEFAHLITLQRNFAASFSNKHQDVLRSGTHVVFQSLATAATANVLRSIQSEINGLHGKPIDRAQKVTELMKRKATVRAGRHESSDRALEVRLLRGATPELHRPARQALVEALVEDRYSAIPNRSSQERVMEFASEAFRLFSIKPAELNPKRFAARASADPQAAFLTFVQFADRARVLESALLVARTHAIDEGKIMRVVSALRAWDWALARQSADWTGDFADQR